MLPCMPGRSSELRRLLVIAGLGAWAMVGLPLALERSPLDPQRFALWFVLYLGFAAAYFVALAQERPPLTLLAAQALLVVGLVLLLCDGFEGVLLVLVALQLGRVLSRRAGVWWICAQTFLLAVAIGVHWSLRPALQLAPPYLGFQLLAFFLTEALAREALANQALRRAQEVAEENSRLAERVRISRDLHDAIGHHLTALALNLEAAGALAEGRAREAIESAKSIARLLLAEVRTVVDELREPAPIDLAFELRAMAVEMPRPRVHIEVAKSLVCTDAQGARTVLLVAQEIVTNAARHASADNLWIDLVQRDGFIELSARDDGVGAGEPLPGRGLSGMRERLEHAGGSIEVSTRPGLGFRLRVTLPLAPPLT
jgi:signal transduction histidine kinase